MEDRTDEPRVRVDYGGWISGPSMTLATCQACGAEIQLVGATWLATTYADISGFCPASTDDERHQPCE
jgi:hypothetical protein